MSSGGLASKDDNAALWLNNKLGSPTHLWSFSSTVASQYTVDKLQSIRDCFTTLDSLVKFKFFLSLFHIPKRNFDEFKPIVQEIIENTIQTCLDQWVLSIAMFVQTYWMTQSLDSHTDYELESFKEAISDLKRILKECIETESGCERSRFLLPIEFEYLNKEARLNLLPNNTSFSNEFLYSLTASQEENSLFKKHFNLVKSTKISKLDDLKLKASQHSKSKTTKSLTNSGLNSFAEYTESLLNNGGTNLNTNLSSSASKTVPYMNRFNNSKKLESMSNSNLLNNNNNLLNSSDSYSSKIFTNTSNLNSFNNNNNNNSINKNVNSSSSSSSFFKRSMLTTSNTSTTITGKSSSVVKRNVGIKLLDVQEQSATPKEAKRKRKEQEKELLKKQKVIENNQKPANLDINNKDDEEQQQLDDESKTENIDLNSDLKNKILDSSLNNNNNNNNSFDELKNTDTIKINNDLLLSSSSIPNGYNNNNNSQIETNLFQNKLNIEQFSNNNNNPFFDNNNNSNNNTLLLNQQFQQMQSNQQLQQQQQNPSQQASSINDLYQPISQNNQQLHQQQSPMLGQMPRMHSVLLQSDTNLQHHHHQQQQQQMPLTESLQNFRTNNNLNHQNMLNNNNNLINYSNTLPNRQPFDLKQIQTISNLNSTPNRLFNDTNKLEQFTVTTTNNNNNNLNNNSMIYSNFNSNASLSSFLTSPLASNIQQQQQQQQQESQHEQIIQQQQKQQQIIQQQQQQQKQQQPHQSLSLTREQMLQAQEMFSNSNKLTRPEKALILGFIAGSRENPRPEHGPLITIKLNESEEMLTSSSGQQHKVLSELFFQMNYDTGEYKKIKKMKPIVLST